MINNQIQNYTQSLLKNERVRFSSELTTDIHYLLKGAWYIPNFICDFKDTNLFEGIMKELDDCEIVNWSKHFKYENPTQSKISMDLIQKLSNLFNIDILATRINYYPDGTSWKPFHHDSHAFSDGKKENFTMGISLGSSRILAFKHVETGEIFHFPQNNGDIFAFDSVVNKKFMHGIPQTHEVSGKRISIIAWGKRRTDSSSGDSFLKDTKIPKKINKLLDKMKNKNIVQYGWTNH